jgi:quinol monooxygenase YgiN
MSTVVPPTHTPLTRRTVSLGLGGALVLAACRPRRGHSPGDAPMIVEYVRYTIPAERQDAFVAAYRDAAAELRASSHCLRYELTQCVEEPSSFVVRIEWDSIEGHMQGFRKDPEFPPFFVKVKPFFADIQEMRHYALTDVRTGAA